MSSAKKKRLVIGSLCKVKPEDKEKGMPNYIQIRDDISLKKGEFLRAESKAFQLENLEKAITSGKLSEEIGGQIRERIEKIPDWVIAELIVLR
jgi:hypothetical protein